MLSIFYGEFTFRNGQDVLAIQYNVLGKLDSQYIVRTVVPRYHYTKAPNGPMVLILDGYSELGAHMQRENGIQKEKLRKK